MRPDAELASWHANAWSRLLWCACVQMEEHAMNEEMHQQVDTGELSVACYKHLAESMGRMKEAGASLFEVAFIVSTVPAYSFTDANTDEESIGQLRTSERHTCACAASRTMAGRIVGISSRAGSCLIKMTASFASITNLGFSSRLNRTYPRRSPSSIIYTILDRNRAVQRVSTANDCARQTGLA